MFSQGNSPCDFWLFCIIKQYNTSYPQCDTSSFFGKPEKKKRVRSTLKSRHASDSRPSDESLTFADWQSFARLSIRVVRTSLLQRVGSVVVLNNNSTFKHDDSAAGATPWWGGHHDGGVHRSLRVMDGQACSGEECHGVTARNHFQQTPRHPVPKFPFHCPPAEVCPWSTQGRLR